MVDTSTTYLGLKLINPVVVAACPLTGELDVLRRIEDNGAAAAVLPSLFEEQIDRTKPDVKNFATATSSERLYVESLSYYHELKEYNRGPDVYLKHLEAAKRAVSIPIIGSLNVTALGSWIEYARAIERAGADALELNVYFLAADAQVTSQEVEDRYVKLVSAVRSEITIPLAVKISPFFTALPNMARRLVDAGANGLVLFNRFLQPDIDLDAQRVVPRLALSTPDELRMPLRWIAILSGRIKASLAASSGAHFADDVIKLVMAGADVVMVASTLYRHGAEVLRTLVDGIAYWLETNEFHSIEQIRGCLSHRGCPDPSAFERANYTKALASFVNQADNQGSSH